MRQKNPVDQRIPTRGTSTCEPAVFIRKRAEKVIAGALRDEVGFARAVKAMVAHTIKEYRGRFLHELIQNGYDAHSAETRDGKIAIIFDEDEGAHGVLYVANGGRPLSQSNFERMATLGESDKPIGEGIGNKGVGFKSVFQVCDVPEIYSALDDTDIGFNGFSFRLGTHADLLELLRGNVQQANQVEKNLSLSMLTVPLHGVPHGAQKLREQGYVTVLRLPASSPRAAVEIQERIERLRNSSAPVMLFLERLSSMTVQASSQSKSEVLSRKEVLTSPSGKKVVLNDELRFRVFTHDVPRTLLRSALQESVDEGALDERWLAWDAAAKVSVAVGDGWEVTDPHAFTYLPMGDNAAAPFSGHVNAPFVTDFARLGLDAEQPVNRIFFESAAELCLRSAEQLVTEGKQNANSVIDLMAWTPSTLSFLLEACDRLHNRSLAEVIQVPDLHSEWTPLSSVHLWPITSGHAITPDSIVKVTDAKLVSPIHLDSTRVNKLVETGKHLGIVLEPTGEMLGEWVERLAGHLAATKASMSQWQIFYNELPDLFGSGETLFGRKLLLSGDGTIARCNPKPGNNNEGKRIQGHRAVFFAPKNTSTDDDDAVESDLDIAPPTSLKRRLVFMHRDLDWYTGSLRTRGRAFLQDNGLARQFRTAGLLLHLGQVMSGRPTPEVKKDALEFAFRLFANNPTKHSKELASVGLEVPTLDGTWIPAASARFSAGWQVPGAQELSALAALDNGAFPELSQLSGLLLSQPENVDTTGIQLERWRDFLRVIGVSTTLPIISRPDNRAFKGRNLTRDYIAGSSVSKEIPEGVVAQWLPALDFAGNFHHPDTQFTTSDRTCWFIGQHELPTLSRQTKLAYARLIAMTLPSLTTEQQHSSWKRKTSGGRSSTIPTPLTAFLRFEKWMPVAQPRSEEMKFVSPSEVWFIKQDDLMAASYSPVLHAQIRALLTALPDFKSERKRLKMPLWGEPADAAKLIDHVNELLGIGDVPDTALEHTRSTLASAWAHVGSHNLEPRLDHGVTVDKAGHLLVAQDFEIDTDPLFITSLDDKSTTTRLIRELGWPTIDVDSTDPAVLVEVARLLREKWPADVQVASGWKLEVLTDGSPWKARPDSGRLAAEVPWLPLLVACTMRYPRASALRSGKQISKSLEDLSRIRLVGCESISISTSTGHERLPQRLRGVLPMPGAQPVLLVEGLTSPPAWDQLEVLAEAALELLGQSRFSAELSLNLRKLASEATDTSYKPENYEIADALGTLPRLVDETEAQVLGSVTGLVARLCHVAPFLWEAEIALVMRPDNPDLLSMEGVRAVVTTAFSGDARAAEQLLQTAAASATSDDLRRKLGIGLKEFNSVLADRFPGTPAIDHSEQFTHEFNLRKSIRRKELLNRARHARLEDFRSLKCQDDWPAIRNLAFLTADPEWGRSVDELTDELVDQHIDALMSSRFSQDSSHTNLPDWDVIQELNGKPLLDKLTTVSRTIRAWLAREKNDLMPIWTGAAAPETVRERLDAVGALDFVRIDDLTLLNWLDTLKLWPSEMERTLDLNTLGLTDEDLSVQASAAAAAQEARLRQQRQVALHGEVIDLDDTMNTLITNVHKFLQENPESLETPYRTTSLRTTTQEQFRGSNVARAVSSQRRPQRMSDLQRNALGLAGELIAYHWLRKRDPGHVDELCWKSRNAGLAIIGRTGNDGLGYDFEVPRAEGTVMYEVKATQGEAGMIELGETEVRCAQEHARTDRWRLLVVEEALSVSPRIIMLPNPFRSDSRSKYSFVGNSVRLRFTLSS